MINLSYLAAATCAKLSRGVCYSQESAVFFFFFLRPCAPLNVSNLAVWTNIFRRNDLFLLAVNPP